MQIANILNKHPSVIHANDMQELCTPLKQLGITYFGHARIDEAGGLTTNCNDPKFFSHYYQQAFYQYDLHLADQIDNARYFLWDLVERYGATETLYQTGIEFGLSHTFTIIENIGKVQNYYHFATKPGHDYMNEFYLQHVDLLEKFVAYFKDALLENGTLNQAYQEAHKVNVKINHGGYLIKNSFGKFVKQHDIIRFLNNIDERKQKFEYQKPVINLNTNEIYCAYYLLLGKTAIEIAQILKVSSVVVANCIKRLKQYYNVDSDLKLIGAILSSNVLANSKLFSFAELNDITAILLKRFHDDIQKS